MLALDAAKLNGSSLRGMQIVGLRMRGSTLKQGSKATSSAAFFIAH
jgi:hypothetical protein